MASHIYFAYCERRGTVLLGTAWAIAHRYRWRHPVPYRSRPVSYFEGADVRLIGKVPIAADEGLGLVVEMRWRDRLWPGWEDDPSLDTPTGLPATPAVLAAIRAGTTPPDDSDYELLRLPDPDAGPRLVPFASGIGRARRRRA